MRTAEDGPPQWLQLDTGEAEHRLLEQSTHPDLFPIRRDECRESGIFGGESQIEGEAGECHHEAVGRIVAADLIGRQIGTGGAHSAYTGLRRSEEHQSELQSLR